MAMLQETIREELKEAMRAKDEVKLRTVRGMITAFTNELVATNRKPQDVLNDEEVLTVIRRLAKQRKESITQFRAGGREDLAEGEVAELSVLESYLPQMMAKDDIRKIVEAKKEELGITDKAKLGQFVGMLMKDLKGKADGADVKEIAESLFN
jgi:uncharacterized protein YqeY